MKFIATLFIFALLSLLRAQTTIVNVSGTVADAQGAAVSSASVLFISHAYGDTTTATTDKNGQYAVDIQLFPTGVQERQNQPGRFQLHQNYPNPFNPSTVITMSLARSAHVNLTVYNILGQRIRTLVDQMQAAGQFRVAWDGANDLGVPAPAGLYLYQMQADDYTETKKMLLIDGSAPTAAGSGGRTFLLKPTDAVSYDVVVKKEAFIDLVDDSFVLDAGQADVEKNITTPVLSTVIAIDPATTFQTIDGFGGYGGFSNWKNDPAFVDLLVHDMGLTMLRTNIPPSLEAVNDDDDPHHFNWDAFHFYDNGGGGEFLGDRIDYLKSLKAAGDVKIISTVWSPPGWMKKSGQANGKQEAAPDPYSTDCALKDDMMDEFAEMMVAYITLMKQEADLDIYAVSLQNEPAFEEPYNSCVYSPNKLHNLVKVVGTRFKDEGIKTMIFAAEDLGWHDRVMRFLNANMDDPESRQYIGRNAVHGYALDGKTGQGYQATQWEELYETGAQYDIPLWMTETSGYSDDYAGAMKLAQAMHFGLYYGKISAWVWWSLSVGKNNPNAAPFGLILGINQKTIRYYAAKHFYKFIRPGMVQIASSSFDEDVRVVAFADPESGAKSIVLINGGTEQKELTLYGKDLPAEMNIFRTTQRERCQKIGVQATGQPLSLWNDTIITLTTME